MSDTIDDLKRSIEENPNPRLYIQLADRYRENDDLDASRETLTACLQQYPGYLSARIALAKLTFAAQDYATTLTLTGDILQSDPENLVALNLSAQTHHATGNNVEAIKHYKRLRAINPGDREVEEKIFDLENNLRPTLSPREQKQESLKALLDSLQGWRSRHGV